MGTGRCRALLLTFSPVLALLPSFPSTAQVISARRLPNDRTQAVTYVALGDSTVYGEGATGSERNYVSLLHERLRAVYPASRLGNRGVRGASAANVVDGQLERAVALRPDLVTLSIGPNDITRGRAEAEDEQDLETIFGMLLKETPAVLAVNLIPDLTLTPRFRGREGAAGAGGGVGGFTRGLGGTGGTPGGRS